MSDKTPSASAPTKAEERKTPAEWAESKGLVGALDPLRPWLPPHKSALYAAADVLHGWTADAHDYQAEDQRLRLSESDFDKALEAAGNYPAALAHEPACGRQFKDRAKPVIDPHTGAELGAGKTVHAKAVKSNG